MKHAQEAAMADTAECPWFDQNFDQETGKPEAGECWLAARPNDSSINVPMCRSIDRATCPFREIGIGLMRAIEGEDLTT